MPHKLNCWEYKSCGREPGGLIAEQDGICPVSQAFDQDGINNGQAGGRICWRIYNRLAGLPSDRDLPVLIPCKRCDFYRRVVFEEAEDIALPLADTPA